jgi:hypothetical protein
MYPPPYCKRSGPGLQVMSGPDLQVMLEDLNSRGGLQILENKTAHSYTRSRIPVSTNV